MEQFFGILSDLFRAYDFGPKEESIIRDMFIFNMRNEEFRKQFCKETFMPADALQFAVVCEGDRRKDV